jgi:8-oxo-dGTP pyrophosphatase MutT (NUDIX family)
MALMDEQDWYASLATSYGSAAALITDRDSPAASVLLVKPNYRDHWNLPGGMLEDGEPPHAGARREVEEELGLAIDLGPLVAVAWAGPEGDRPKPSVRWIFDGGVLADPGAVRLQLEELDDWRFVTPADFGEYLPPFMARRARGAVAGKATGRTVYVASGLPEP